MDKFDLILFFLYAKGFFMHGRVHFHLVRLTIAVIHSAIASCLGFLSKWGNVKRITECVSKRLFIPYQVSELTVFISTAYQYSN